MKTEIIAEIGHNHNGNIELAKKMIRTIKECGADVAKFQLYDIDTIKRPIDSHYQELKDAQLTRRQLGELFRECQRVGIEFLASVFDHTRVEWTEELGVKRYKIASRSVRNYPLIAAIEATKKPIIVSLGGWEHKFFPAIKGDVSFLYCIPYWKLRLEGFKSLPHDFNRYSGFSDHTIGIKWAKEAIRRGAGIIEKHFTLDKNMAGCDQGGSMEPNELKELVNYAKECFPK